jgi:TonB family protein
MKKMIYLLTFLALYLFPQIQIISQEQKKDVATSTKSAEWIRVQSDNGEFSIEVPEKYDYFFDKDGFWTAYRQNNYKLEDMSLLNSYHDQNLLSFEVYEAKKAALSALVEDDKRTGEYSEFDRNGTKIKQVIYKTDKSYTIRQYFNSKKFIYILTAASRKEETSAMKRFFDSVIFMPDTKETPNSAIVSFSKLKITPIELDTKQDKQDQTINQTSGADTTAKSPDENSKKLIVVSRPRAAYVDSARMKHVQGRIAFRIYFSANGHISKIDVLKSLPDGLLRQAVFAALRLKFLPAEKDGKAIPTTKTVEYQFTIY